MDNDSDAQEDLAGAIVSHTKRGEILVDLDKVPLQPAVKHNYQCNEIASGLMFASWLLITDTSVIKLREIQGKGHQAAIMWKRPLITIVKITAKKKHPTLLSFVYSAAAARADSSVSAADTLQPSTPQPSTPAATAGSLLDMPNTPAAGNRTPAPNLMDADIDSTPAAVGSSTTAPNPDNTADNAFGIDDELDPLASTASPKPTTSPLQTTSGSDQRSTGNTNEPTTPVSPMPSSSVKSDQQNSSASSGSKAHSKKNSGERMERYLIPEAAQAKITFRDMIFAARKAAGLQV